MKSLSDLLTFAQNLRGAIVRGDLKRVANDEMTAEAAAERSECMDGIVASLQLRVDLAEVGEEMKKFSAQEAAQPEVRK
jgi:hypothetical protein